MKTYFKGIKTVAVIFLSLTLFSCQDEVIVPQDTLSKTSDQLKPKKGSVQYFSAELDPMEFKGEDNALESTDCGVTNSKNLNMQFTYLCTVMVDVKITEVDFLTLSVQTIVAPSKDSNEYTVVFGHGGTPYSYRAIFTANVTGDLDGIHYVDPDDHIIRVEIKTGKGKKADWNDFGEARSGKLF